MQERILYTMDLPNTYTKIETVEFFQDSSESNGQGNFVYVHAKNGQESITEKFVMSEPDVKL